MCWPLLPREEPLRTEAGCCQRRDHRPGLGVAESERRLREDVVDPTGVRQFKRGPLSLSSLRIQICR